MEHLYHDLYPIKAAPTAHVMTHPSNGNTTTVGPIIDTKGYKRGLWVFFTGVVTDGDYSFTLFQDTDSAMGTESAVDGADDGLLGTLPAWTADTDDEKVITVEQIFQKRYVRCKLVQANGSSGAYVGAILLLGQPMHASVQP